MMASHEVIRPDLFQLRRDRPAFLRAVFATGVEFAAGWRVHRARDVPFQHDQFTSVIGRRRDRRQQDRTPNRTLRKRTFS